MEVGAENLVNPYACKQIIESFEPVMQQYGITSIKRFNNDDGDIYVAQKSDKKETKIILPSDSKFSILVDNDNGQKCIYNNYNMPTPCIIEKGKGNNRYVHCKSVNLFIIFDEVIKVNPYREFFRRSIVTNASDINKFANKLDELKEKGYLDWYVKKNQVKVDDIVS